MTRFTSDVCHAVVPCAGIGTRAGAALPKQYVSVAGKAVVEHTLDALAGVGRLRTTTVVLSSDDTDFERCVGAVARGRVIAVRRGGATRAETVGNGLDALTARGIPEHDWVLVHDAARCLVRPEWIDRLIDDCLDDAVGGLLALPVADTLKREGGGRVAATVGRGGIWQAQTPQMFRLGALSAALVRAGAEVTDEAGAMEAAGHAPRLVPGDLENVKLTHSADFALADRLLRSR